MSWAFKSDVLVLVLAYGPLMKWVLACKILVLAFYIH